MTTASTCKEQSCSEKIRADHFLCREHWQKGQDGEINECPQCGVYKDSKYPLCIECNKKASASTRASSTCKEQSCSEKIRADHFLCREHWQKGQDGEINECPQCGVYKDSKYPLCIECNKKASASTRASRAETPKPSAGPPRTHWYDPPKADSFAERSALLDDDQKSKDKRQLFHDQQRKCVYCGNVYNYDELEIDHIIPKALGGPDNIRNCQAACKSCNQSKGTMTDIQFRQKHAKFLPQKERTAANPPIKPELLRATVKNRPFRWFQRK